MSDSKAIPPTEEQAHNDAVDWARANVTPELIAQSRLAIKALGGTVTAETMAVYSLVVSRRAAQEAKARAAAAETELAAEREAHAKTRAQVERWVRAEAATVDANIRIGAKGLSETQRADGLAEELASEKALRERAERGLAELKARRFPVLMQSHAAKLRALGCPRVVPWNFIADNEAQCKENHGQTPERLAERGGLAPCEIVAVVEGRKYRRMTDEESVSRLLELLTSYAAPPPSPAKAETCGTCDSPRPHLFAAVQEGGEVHDCRDAFHLIVTPENTVERIEERARLYMQIDGLASGAKEAK